jgi:hypothetical protein
MSSLHPSIGPLPAGPQLDALLILQAQSGERPPVLVQPWPARRAGSIKPPVRMSSAIADVAGYPVEPVRSPSSYSRQVSWMHFVTDESINHSRPSHSQTNSPASASTNTSSRDTISSPPPPAVPVVDPIPPLPPNMNYDTFLSHVNHLFRSAYTMERLLRTGRHKSRNQLPSAMIQPSCHVQFIDPFGTRMQISVQPWETVSSVINQLQSYIPSHLQGWCQIGLINSNQTHLHDNTDTLIATAPVAAAASTMPGIMCSASVQQLSAMMLHKTIAHAQLDTNKPAVSSISSMHDRSNTINNGSSTPSTHEESSQTSIQHPCHSLVAYGSLTVLLRHSPTEQHSSTPMQVHSFTLQVFGLEILSDVMRRINDWAIHHLSRELQCSELFSIQKSFTLPLHMLSARECGGSGSAQLLSLQQSIYSAQLCHIDRVLLVEVQEQIITHIDNSFCVQIHTLTGRQFRVKAKYPDTVAQLKECIFAREEFPIEQQLLLHNQCELTDDSMTLQSAGIDTDSTLQLLLKHRHTSEPNDFYLNCGRAGVNPLSTSLHAVARTVSDMMSWNIPPMNQLRCMSSDTLTSLLLHTRHLLSDCYSAILSKQIVGHSSRGKIWIDESSLTNEYVAKPITAASSTCIQIIDLDSDIKQISSLKRRVEVLNIDMDPPISIDLTHNSIDIIDDAEVQLISTVKPNPTYPPIPTPTPTPTSHALVMISSSILVAPTDTSIDNRECSKQRRRVHAPSTSKDAGKVSRFPLNSHDEVPKLEPA